MLLKEHDNSSYEENQNFIEFSHILLCTTVLSHFKLPVYLFYWAAVRKYHNLSGLKLQNCLFSQCWRLEI